MSRKLVCKGSPPRGPNDSCTCDGCWFCEREAVKLLGESPVVRWFGQRGHLPGCTCDIDWSCVLSDDHSPECWEEETND